MIWDIPANPTGIFAPGYWQADTQFVLRAMVGYRPHPRHWLLLAKLVGMSPAQLGYGTQSLTVFVDDVDEHHARAKAAGAKILEEPHETEYGEYQYAAEDLDGHHWLFSRHVKDRSPEDWGAMVKR